MCIRDSPKTTLTADVNIAGADITGHDSLHIYASTQPAYRDANIDVRATIQLNAAGEALARAGGSTTAHSNTCLLYTSSAPTRAAWAAAPPQGSARSSWRWWWAASWKMCIRDRHILILAEAEDPDVLAEDALTVTVAEDELSGTSMEYGVGLYEASPTVRIVVAEGASLNAAGAVDLIASIRQTSGMVDVMAGVASNFPNFVIVKQPTAEILLHGSITAAQGLSLIHICASAC